MTGQENTDPLALMAEVEALYGKVLDLARRQEASLRSGNLTAVPSLLAEKLQALATAQDLTRAVRGSPGLDPSLPRFQKAVTRVAELLSATVEIEDRCRCLGFPASPPPSRQQAIAAYGRVRGSQGAEK